MKFLSSKAHSAIDYFVVVFLWASPSIFGLNSTVSLLTYSLGSVHLVLTVFTNFHFGIVKVIPVQIHGWIELAVAVLLIISPWVLGSLVPAENLIDKYFFFGFG